MASFLEKLGSREAVLLMYLAEELPAVERAEVERMLAEDPSLQLELNELRRLQGFVAETLDSLQASCDAAADEAAIRRVMREMRRYQLELMARPLVQPEQNRSWPKWVYATATAAAVVFGLIGLWGVGAFDLGPQQPGISPAVVSGLQDEDPAEAVVIMLEEQWLAEDAGEWALDQAAEHAAELQRWDTEDPLLLMTM